MYRCGTARLAAGFLGVEAGGRRRGMRILFCMSDSNQKQRERELELRREQEKKDLDTERTIGRRPLEGMSHAHTSWPPEQDDRAAAEEHAHDEERSRKASEDQIP